MYTLVFIEPMSKRYSIAEARYCLPRIVDQAEAGIEVQLTRRGKPVAAVVAFGVLERLRGDRPQFGAAYREFLQRYSLKDIGLGGEDFGQLRERGDGRQV